MYYVEDALGVRTAAVRLEEWIRTYQEDGQYVRSYQEAGDNEGTGTGFKVNNLLSQVLHFQRSDDDVLFHPDVAAASAACLAAQRA